MSEHLDFSAPLSTDDDRGARARAAEHRVGALTQLRLAADGDHPDLRLAAATVHALTALVTLINDDIAQADDSARADAPTVARPSRYAVHVSLYHNTNPAAAAVGYTHSVEDVVVEVYRYTEHEVAHTVSDREIAARTVELFAAAPDPAAAAEDHRIANYADRGNRPLTRGDVIAIDNRYYTFTGTDIAPIGNPRTAALHGLVPAGTTPL